MLQSEKYYGSLSELYSQDTTIISYHSDIILHTDYIQDFPPQNI